MPHIDLLDLPYFQGISMDSLVSLIDLLEPTQFSPDQLIIRQGQTSPPPLYIATHGRVAVEKIREDTQIQTLAELIAPTIFGEIELFCQLSPLGNIRCLTPVAAFILSRTTFDELFANQHPAITQFTFNIARVACHRLALADEMLARHTDNEDLVQLRHSISTEMSTEQNLLTTTGAFKIPEKFR